LSRELPWLAPYSTKESTMALPNSDPHVETLPLEVSFSYFDNTLQRCFITFHPVRGSHFRFSSSMKVEVRHLESVHSLPISSQEKTLIAGVRQSRISGFVPTQLIRLGRGYATFGPYPVKGIAEHVAAILVAIRQAYRPYGLISPVFTPNWPEQPLSATLARLKGPDCLGVLELTPVGQTAQ